MAMKNFVTGEILTESDLDLYCVNTIHAEKSGNESVTSSTTLQNDDHLVLPLAANSTYWVEGVLNTDGSPSGDIKIAFTGPAGASVLFHILGLSSSAASGADSAQFCYETLGTTGTFGTIAAADHRTIRFAGKFTVAGTAGNLQLQWAQETSNGTATRVLAGSTMWARRIS